METAAYQQPEPARIARAGEARSHPDHLAVKRIDLLLELGRLLVQLAETAAEDQRKPGRLTGAFNVTRLPLLLGQIELSVIALDVLGGLPPESIVELVEQPELFAHHGSALILTALGEIKEAISGESVPARGRSSLQAAIERATVGS